MKGVTKLGGHMKDDPVEVLALEYQSLRADLQVRSAARFQFLGFVTAAAAVLATGLGHSSPGQTTCILEGLGGALFILGLISFWLQGKDQALISAHLANLEERMNHAMSADLLSWETRHQERSFFNYWILGLRYPSPRRKPTKAGPASAPN
jgi:hypothetical protein